jgi:PAS domain S-box-containing protein
VKATILLIDDDYNMHQFIKLALSKANYEIISAFDGQQGLDMVYRDKPDIIILDYMMPKMNGYEVYKKITQDKLLALIPILILTAFQEKPTQKDELFEAGLAAYLNKPFGHNELLNIIENILMTNKIKIRNQKLQQAIKDTKDFLANLINSSPDAIITIDDQGFITYFSQGAEEMLGYSEQEMMGKSFFDFLFHENGSFNLWKQLEEQSVIKNIETNFLTKKNKHIPISFSFSILRNNDNRATGVLAIGKDLTEIKKLESELIEQEKLTLLMETAVAINHEINNPLTPILGNIQLMLQQRAELPLGIVNKLEVVEKNAWRIQQIVKKLNQITQPVKKRYCGETLMLDIENS